MTRRFFSKSLYWSDAALKALSFLALGTGVSFLLLMIVFVPDRDTGITHASSVNAEVTSSHAASATWKNCELAATS